MTDEFKHDVAISLLDRDLSVAEELRTVLRADVAVFLYSEQQKELAGEDGLLSFTEVFRRDSRVVVVLARKDWGDTRWTRVEETAITNRGFEEGWDFLVLVSLEGKEAVPDWVPVTRIWADIERLGVKGLAAVIERKVSDRGKELRRESVLDLHARIERQKLQEQERQTFLGSQDAVRAADVEYESLCARLQEAAPKVGMTVRRDAFRACILTKDGLSLSVSWHRRYGNTLHDSQLAVKLWDGMLSTNVSTKIQAKRAVSELTMRLERIGEAIGWAADSRGARFWPTSELADHCLETLLRSANGEQARL